MILFNHYVLFYLKWMDILNILMMVEKICHLLQMMKKFIKSIYKNIYKNSYYNRDNYEKHLQRINNDVIKL